MPDGYSCDLLRATDELERFRSFWHVLWCEDANATPFQSPTWLLPWWHHFGQTGLRAVVLWRHSRPIAFLPFYICCEPAQSECRLLLVGAGTSDYLDGVFAPDCGAEDVKLALDCALETTGWDVLYAVQLRRSSLLFDVMRCANELNAHSFEAEDCSRIRAVSADRLPAKIRQNARYYRNRAQRTGSLTLEFASEQNWQTAFNAFIDLHTARWQSRDQPGVLADERVLAFHREMIPMMLQEQMLSLCSLRLNGETIAMGYSFVDPVGHRDRTLYIYLIAHSLRHVELRPGTLLLASIIEHAAENGIAWIDMLRGEENYKKLWHVEQEPTFGFSIREASREGRSPSA
jgi:CelD/BcsL family acetyltransferase involved in cellulose biosynthesis